MNPNLIPIFLFANTDDNASFSRAIPTDMVYLYFDALIKTGFDNVLSLGRSFDGSVDIGQENSLSGQVSTDKSYQATIKREYE